MKVKLFISWSGDLSQKIGKELSGWIPKVLQFVEPYFTPDDIGKGKRWSNDISGQLESTDLGIIVLNERKLGEALDHVRGRGIG